MSNANNIKSNASGRWLEILPALAPELDEACRKPGKHVKCPCHGKHDGFRLYPDSAETGGGICNLEGGFQDGFAVLMWRNGWNFLEAIQAVAKYLGLNQGYTISTRQRPQTESAPKKDWFMERERFESIWNESNQAYPLLKTYLECRGLSIDIPQSLRLHRNLYQYKNGTGDRFPTMIARITRDGQMVGLHITFLNHDGTGKAQLDNTRKTWKCADTVSGGAIQLFQPEPNKPFVVTEGIETALAVRSMTGFPVWACGSKSLLGSVRIPDKVRPLFIGMDKDRNEGGETAARKLAERIYKEHGFITTICKPPISIPEGKDSIDWLDYVVQSQEVIHG